MGSYKELKVYEKSYTVAKEIYSTTRSYPREEQYGLVSQVKRAATSIPLNIAEGYGKGTSVAEIMRFLRMAKGSCAEMEVLLDFSYDFGYISKEDHGRYKAQYEEIGKMLSGLINNLKERITNN